MSAIDDLPPLREVVRAHDLKPKKSLGQNFLFDLNLTARIARAAAPLDGVTVVEVGPGPGGLTRALLALGAAKVVAIERDHRCLSALTEIGARYPGRLRPRRRRHDGRSAPASGRGPARIVADLPYNAGTALLVRWLTEEAWPPWWTASP